MQTETLKNQHAAEVSGGERFEFGANWRRFLKTLDDERIDNAERSMRELLDSDSLAGKSFVDAGSGSGLFSLCARRLGARVHSFDYDPQSVGCTAELRRRYFPDDPEWIVDEGSALDPEYLKSLGQFDCVYSWGVLHHTGSMWEALDNVAPLVAPGGKLVLSIYNDQGPRSGRWLALKRFYNRSPSILRGPILAASAVNLFWRRTLKDFLRLRPFESWRSEAQGRGMSAWHDIVDWVGGYPFEVAKPEEILRFYRERGFNLVGLTTVGGSLGCNEFVFEKL